MLQSIRDHTQGWIAGVIISLLILSFALWGIHSYLVSSGSGTIVAKVNGTEITKSQLAVAYERLRRQLQAQFSANYSLPATAEANLKQQALQTLIKIQVLEQGSLAEKYRISSAQIDSYLQSMPEFQVNGQFSLSRFQQLLSSTLFTINDFLTLIRTNLLIEQPRLGLIFTSFPLPNEVNNAIALVNQERDIDYVNFSLQSFMKQDISVPTEKVLAYYNEHQEEFKTPEQVSIDYLEITVKDLMNSIHPSDETLKAFYNENVSAYSAPMQWKLESIKIPLADNASAKETDEAKAKLDAIAKKWMQNANLSQLAHEYAAIADTKLSENWVSLNQIPAEMQKSMMALNKPGMISDTVRTPDGLMLLKVIAVKEAKVQPYDQVKDKVKDALIRQQAEEKFADLKEKLANQTYEHPDTLQTAAEALNLPVKSSEVFTKDKGGKDISSYTKIREAAFSHDVLNNQNNSDVIQLTSDSALVLRLKSHASATLLPLKAVEKQITDKLKVMVADAKLAALVNDLQQKLQQKTVTPQQIAEQYHVQWSKTGFISRHATKVDSAILLTAFSMPKPAANQKTYANVKIPTGYALVLLNDVRERAAKDKQEYNLFAEQVQNTQGLLEYELFKQGLLDRAKIVIEKSG